MTVTARRPTRSTRSTGWVPIALVTLVLVPAVAGSLRLVEVFGGAHVLPATSTLATDLSLGAGWAINLAVAEYVIRRPRTGRTNTMTAQVESS